MFLRSISALPKCLHGRLAPGRCSERLLNSSFSGLLVFQRYTSGLSEATSLQQHNNGHYTEVSDDHGRSVQFIGSAASVDLDRLNARSDLAGLKLDTSLTYWDTDPSHSPCQSDLDYIRRDQEENDIGRNDDIAGESVPLRDSKNTAKTLSSDDEWSWETLHDKFRESRRENPSETSRIFHKQRLLAKRIVGEFEDGEAASLEFRCKWAALQTRERHKILPSLLIGSLVESAAQALFVLDTIWYPPQSFRIRMNCLRSIGLMYSKDLQNDPWLKTLYEMQIERLRTPQSWPEDKMPAVLLQHLLIWSTPEQCQRIIRDFQHKYPDATATSLIAEIDHFLRIGDRDRAFACLQQLPPDLLQQPTGAISAFRDRLVKLDVVARNENGTNFTYLPQLIALGMPSDESLHNAVIESAITNGLPEIAWDVYQYLESSKFDTNARSYLVLLRDSFQRGDLQRVNEIMTAINDRSDLIKDPYLVAYSMNIVRNISCHDDKLKPAEAFAHVMALYDRAYDRSVLTSLGIAQASTSSSDLLQPPPTLLAFTIWTYILIQTHDPHVQRLWQWIQYAIMNGQKSIGDTAKHDIIFNGLILYHGRQPKNLSRALEVVRFMLNNKLCLPTSRTWSILLCSFLKHGLEQQARGVLSMMRQKGFKVEEVEQRYSEYVPTGYNLKEMIATLDETLDDKQMPAGLEELMIESRSLQ